MKRLALILFLLLAVPAYAGETAPLVMKAGADYRATFTWKTPGTGVPINLTGSTFAAQFRSAAYPAGTLFATYSAIVTNAAAGQMQLRLSRAQTRANSGRTGVWDLQQTSGGLVTYRFGGTGVVQPTVTAP